MSQPMNSSVSSYMTRMLIFNTMMCALYLTALLILTEMSWAQVFGILLAITEILFFLVVWMVVVDKEKEGHA